MHPPNCNGHWTPKSLCQSPDNQSGVASRPPGGPSPQGPLKVAALGTSQCHLILANTMKRSLMPGVSAPLLSTPWLCDKVAMRSLTKSYDGTPAAVVS